MTPAQQVLDRLYIIADRLEDGSEAQTALLAVADAMDVSALNDTMTVNVPKLARRLLPLASQPQQP